MSKTGKTPMKITILEVGIKYSEFCLSESNPFEQNLYICQDDACMTMLRQSFNCTMKG